MIEADRADHSRAKLDHDLIVPITKSSGVLKMLNKFIYFCDKCGCSL